MEIHEKIVKIRKDKKITLTEAHKRITNLFGKKAISYRTLIRLEQGHTEGRETSLYQLCLVLGITPDQLKEKTQQKNASINVFRKLEEKPCLVYNNKASIETLIGPGQADFVLLELIFKPKGQTREIAEPKGNKKIIHILKGAVNCVIGKETIYLEHGDTVSFESDLPHHLINKSRFNSRCLIIQTYQKIL